MDVGMDGGLRLADRDTRSVSPLRYRPEIDGLRAIAVLSVIFNHYRLLQATAGGFVGVDVFFVISGYLITRIILSQLEAQRFSVISFYLNRARRILPALFLVMGVTAVGAYFVLLPYELTLFGRELVSASIFLSNVYYNKLGGYFDTPQQDRLLLHSWSLGVEEQFYILWPALLITCSRISCRRGGGWLPVLLIAALSLALAQGTLAQHPRFVFYELPPRAWEFAVGALISLPPLCSGLGGIRGWSRGLFAFGGLGMIISAILVYDDGTPFPGLTAALPCIGTAAFILFAEHTWCGSAISWKPFVAIGRMSYSLYLWHWPLLVLTRLVMSRELTIQERMLLIGVVFAVSWLSWSFVEKPLRSRHAAESFRPAMWSVIATGMASAYVAAGLTFHVTNGFPNRVPSEPAWLTAADRDAAAFQESSCLARGADLPPVAPCLLGQKSLDSTYSVVLWGDSHAAQWAPAIDRIGQEMGFTAREITKAGCGPFPGLQMRPTSDMVQDCGLFSARALSVIATARTVRVVLIAARWEPIVRGDLLLTKADLTASQENSRSLLTSSLHETIEALNARNIFVVVLGQVPVPRGNAFTCVRRELFFRGDSQRCFVDSKSDYPEEEKLSSNLLRAALSDTDGAILVPMFSPFCSEAGCRFDQGSRLNYMDATHLSSASAIDYSQPIKEALAQGLSFALRHSLSETP